MILRYFDQNFIPHYVASLPVSVSLSVFLSLLVFHQFADGGGGGEGVEELDEEEVNGGDKGKKGEEVMPMAG